MACERAPTSNPVIASLRAAFQVLRLRPCVCGPCWRRVLVVYQGRDLAALPAEQEGLLVACERASTGNSAITSLRTVAWVHAVARSCRA